MCELVDQIDQLFPLSNDIQMIERMCIQLVEGMLLNRYYFDSKYYQALTTNQ